MSQITIDLDASPRVLLTAAAMLRELAEGGPKLQPPAESTEPAAPEATVPSASELTHAPDVVGIVQEVAPESSESQADVPAAEEDASALEVDRDGLPWDSRIHSSSKAKNADGRWKKQRLTAAKNMTPEQWEAYITQVENELRGALAAPSALTEFIENVPSLGTPYEAPEQTATHTPPPESEPKTWNFITVMQSLARAGKKDDEVNEVLASFGLQKVSQLGARADLCAPFALALGLN